MKFNLYYLLSLASLESWRRNADKDSDGLKNETDRWRKRDDAKIEDSWKKKDTTERRDVDKWRRNDDSDRWKKDSAEKWRKDDNYERDDLRDRDRIERGFDKRDDRERDRDRDRGIDGRGVSIRFPNTYYIHYSILYTELLFLYYYSIRLYFLKLY